MIQNIVNTDNILSVLDDYISSHNSDDIAMGIARDFRNRRVEKGLTREQLAEKAKISVSNVTDFTEKPHRTSYSFRLHSGNKEYLLRA